MRKGRPESEVKEEPVATARRRSPKVFHYPGGLEGISEEQISQHRDVIYVGCVSKLNEVEERLGGAERKEASDVYSEFRELKREETFATNGVFLHEGYFGSMAPGGKEPEGKVRELLERDFGSLSAWREELKAVGMASRGWAVLAMNLEDGLLRNYLCDSHDVGGVWNSMTLLAVDVAEHSYFIDYKTQRAAYLEAFLRNVDWEAVNRRVEKALRMQEVYSQG